MNVLVACGNIRSVVAQIETHSAQIGAVLAERCMCGIVGFVVDIRAKVGVEGYRRRERAIANYAVVCKRIIVRLEQTKSHLVATINIILKPYIQQMVFRI